MLIATFTAIMILMGGGGVLFNFDIFKDVVKDQIEDKDLRKELVADMDNANTALKTYNKDMKDLGKKVAKTNAHYYSTEGEFSALTALADTKRLDTIRQMLDARYALIEKMTPEQWDAMYAGVDAKVAEKRAKAEEKANKKAKKKADE